MIKNEHIYLLVLILLSQSTQTQTLIQDNFENYQIG